MTKKVKSKVLETLAQFQRFKRIYKININFIISSNQIKIKREIR